VLQSARKLETRTSLLAWEKFCKGQRNAQTPPFPKRFVLRRPEDETFKGMFFQLSLLLPNALWLPLRFVPALLLKAFAWFCVHLVSGHHSLSYHLELLWLHQSDLVLASVL
jgi:hypothetical protein